MLHHNHVLPIFPTAVNKTNSLGAFSPVCSRKAANKHQYTSIIFKHGSVTVALRPAIFTLHTTAPRHRSASRALQKQAGIYNRQTLCIPHHPQLHLPTILQTFFERPGAACFVRYEAAIWVTAACICTTPFIRLGLH